MLKTRDGRRAASGGGAAPRTHRDVLPDERKGAAAFPGPAQFACIMFPPSSMDGAAVHSTGMIGSARHRRDINLPTWHSLFTQWTTGECMFYRLSTPAVLSR